MRKEKWRRLFFLFCLAAGFLFLLMVRSILGPFFVGFVLAYILCPLVDWLGKHGFSRKWAIAAVFSGIIIVCAAVYLVMLPVMYTELSKLANVLPQTMENMELRLQELRSGFQSTGLPSKVTQVIDEYLVKGEAFLALELDRFLGSLPEKLISLSLFLISPVLTIYFLADWARIKEGFWRLVPQNHRMEWRRLWQDVNHVIHRFIKGNLVVAVIVGVLIGVGVKLVGMDYALLIGLICGLFDLIPCFGPLLGAIPCVLLGLIKSPLMAVKVAAIILIVQQLEGGVISPKLMGNSVGLHPLTIVFVLLAGGKLAGFWGMLLAVPVAAVSKIIIQHIYLRLVSPQV